MLETFFATLMSVLSFLGCGILVFLVIWMIIVVIVMILGGGL